MALFTFVQSTKTVGTNTTTMTASSTVGDVIVVAEAMFSVVLATAVSDSLGNTYSLIGTSSQQNIWVAPVTTGGTATITFSGATGANHSYIIAEYTAPANFTALSDAAFINTSPWTYVYGNKMVGTSTQEVLVILTAYNPHTSSTYTFSSATLRQQTSEGGGEALVYGDKDITSSVATTTETITPNSGSINWAIPVTLVGNSGGGGAAGGAILLGMDAGLRG